MLESEDTVTRLDRRCYMVQAHRLTQDREQKPMDTDRSPGYVYKCFFLPILDPSRNSVGKHRKEPRIWI